LPAKEFFSHAPELCLGLVDLLVGGFEVLLAIVGSSHPGKKFAPNMLLRRFDGVAKPIVSLAEPL